MDLFSSKVAVGDGAMGTRLQALVGTSQGCIDGLNIDRVFAKL